MHIEELHSFYFSLNIIQCSNQEVCYGQGIGCMGEKKDACQVLVGNLNKKDHFVDLSVDGKIVLEWILN